MPTRNIAFALVLVLLAAAWGRFSVTMDARETVSASGGERSASGAAPIAEQVQPVDPPTPNRIATAQTAAARLPSAPEGLGFDAEEFLSALPHQLDQIARRANSGEPAALQELADWMAYCESSRGLARQLPGRMRDRDGASIGAATDYFSRLENVCTLWIARTPWLREQQQRLGEAWQARIAAVSSGATGTRAPPAPSPLSTTLRQRAAEAGDLAAQMESVDPQLRAGCAQVSSQSTALDRRESDHCLYARIREQLAAIIARRDPRQLAAVSYLVAPLMFRYPPASEYVSGDLPTVQVRWNLVGCHYGLNCGPTGNLLRMACAQGHCGYASYGDYAGDALLAPARMRAISQQVAQLIVLIDAGNVDAIVGPPPPPLPERQ